jgi:hypothetical protein
MSKIIYPTDDGGVCVLHPIVDVMSLEDIARKDVPAGTPYRIVADDDIPTDPIFRNAWEADFSNPDGYGIGADAWFAQQEVTE